MPVRLSDVAISDNKPLRLSDINDDSNTVSIRTDFSDTYPPKKNILDFWSGGKDQIPEENWIARGIYQTGVDAGSVPAHLVNQLLLNYPREMTKKLGFEYPEEMSSAKGEDVNAPINFLRKLSPSLSYSAGIIGAINSAPVRVAGALSKAPQVASVLAKVPNIAKAMVSGAALGGAYATDNNEENVTNAAIGTAIPIGGAILSKSLKSIAAANPKGRLTQMKDSLQSLHNAYESGIKYSYENGKKVEVSNPIKTMIDMKTIPVVKNGKADTSEVVQKMNDKLGELSSAYKASIDPNKTISIDELWNKVSTNIKRDKYLKSSGQVGNTLSKAESIIKDYRNSYGDNIPLNTVDDIRMTMNSKYDPDLKDAFRAVGDSARRVMYENIPSARDMLSKEGEILSARNFAESMNNKVVKGGRLGNYVGQVLGATIGSSTEIPVVGPILGALGGNAASQALQQNYFRGNILSRPAGITNKVGNILVDWLISNAKTPLIQEIVDIRPLSKSEQAIYNMRRFGKGNILSSEKRSINRLLIDNYTSRNLPNKSMDGVNPYSKGKPMGYQGSEDVIYGNPPNELQQLKSNLMDLKRSGRLKDYLENNASPIEFDSGISQENFNNLIKKAKSRGVIPSDYSSPRKKITAAEMIKLMKQKSKGRILRPENNIKDRPRDTKAIYEK